MLDLVTIRDAYIDEGLSYAQAEARTAQDAMLDLIAKSPMVRNVTIKGGVLMQHISKSSRRATMDFDLDFVRYSIADDSIRRFFESLNDGSSDFSISLTGKIEELKHQDYRGKRVHVRIADSGGSAIVTKVDIGVHTLLSPESEDICFDLGKLDESVTLLGDSNEQIVAEKLRSLLRIGAASTRYKDVFDVYYLLILKGVRKEALYQALHTLVLDDVTMHETSYEQIAARLKSIFGNRRFSNQLKRAKNDWLDVPPEDVMSDIIRYFE